MGVWSIVGQVVQRHGTAGGLAIGIASVQTVDIAVVVVISGVAVVEIVSVVIVAIFHSRRHTTRRSTTLGLNGRWRRQVLTVRG